MPLAEIIGTSNPPDIRMLDIFSALSDRPLNFRSAHKLTPELLRVLNWFVPDGQILRLGTLAGVSCVAYADRITFGGSLLAAHGNPTARVGTVAYELMPLGDTPTVHLARIHKAGGGPIMRPHLARAVAMFERVGFARIDVEAGWRSGPVYWARAGFDFSIPLLLGHCEAVLARMVGGYAETPRITCAADLLNLQRIDTKQPRSIRDAFFVSQTIDPMWTQGEAHLHVLDRKYGIGTRVERTIGEAILYAISPWPGSLDLRDRAQVEAYRDFVEMRRR